MTEEPKKSTEFKNFERLTKRLLSVESSISPRGVSYSTRCGVKPHMCSTLETAK